ncbi:MAG: GNAT family N-acetyltransferase, partial [Lachnospiraceae bacterium]
DIPSVLNLCESNPQYYDYCPPVVSAKAIKSDLTALPPDKTYEDKYYVGFWKGNQLIAVMDLIFKYPDKETTFIGFFMVNSKLQRCGVGSNIITECLQFLKRLEYTKVRLGYVKGNPQAKAFWAKNQFKPTGVESIQEHYTVIVTEKVL